MPNLNLPEEPGTNVAEEIIFNLLPEWWAKFAQKNSAYGDKLSKGGDLGIKAFIPEMNRKMQGIINQVWEGEPQGVGESAREKAMDLIGHLFIFIANLDAEADVPLAFHHQQSPARSALGWPHPKPMTYEELKAHGNALLEQGAKGVLCPDDTSHHLDAHAPGGAWFGKGHGGRRSPWQPGLSQEPHRWAWPQENPKPNVSVDPMTGDLQPHPLMRNPWLRQDGSLPVVVQAAPPIHPVRTVNEEEPKPRAGAYDWREWEPED